MVDNTFPFLAENFLGLFFGGVFAAPHGLFTVISPKNVLRLNGNIYRTNHARGDDQHAILGGETLEPIWMLLLRFVDVGERRNRCDN